MFQPDAVYRLSHRISIRPTPEGFLVESPLSGMAFSLTNPSVLRLLFALASPVRISELVEGVEEERRPAVLEFLRQCWENRVVTRVGEDGTAEEDTGSLAQWEFHDLFFHYRSRSGRNPWPLGATYPMRGSLPPAPALREAHGNGAVPLARPDLAALLESDMTLSRALEERRSGYSTQPVGIADLGEFLYRTCRVTAARAEADGELLLNKVYPSGGGLHPLEVYVVAAGCDGLDPGVYHYRAAEHALDRVCGLTSEARELLRETRVRTGGRLAHDPPVLLVVSARFRRVMWKYQSIAYRLVLAELGALYQTMYLVATAMRLSPCAIGAGDPDRFAQVVGTDYYDETSVGEFLLGGPPPATG